MSLNFKTNKQNREIITSGAELHGLYNIKIKLRDKTIDYDAFYETGKEFVNFVINYQIENDVKIKPNETLTYGFWLVKFIEYSSYLEVFEIDATASEFIEGLDMTLQFWGEQMYICEEVEADFDPPTADQLITISSNILFGENDLKGVRLNNKEDLSGWLLYKNEKDLDDDSKMITMRLHEFILKRPDLVGFLALPHGYRIIIEKDGYDAWFDKDSL